MAVALGQVYLVRDVVMGDAFIHFTFARGITEGQPFFYNGEFSAGSTSPLWSIMLASLWELFGMDIVWAVKIFASFFVALSVLLTFVVGFKISRNKYLSFAAATLVAASYVFSFWAAKGMETPFYVCLVLLSFLFYLTLVNPPDVWRVNARKNLTLEVALGILLGLGILTRPEMWFFSLFIGIPLLVKKGWRVLFSVGIPAALIFSPYYFYLFENTGSIFPSSAARILRAQQWAQEVSGIHFTLELFKILITKLLPLTPFFLLFFWQKTKGNPPPRWWLTYPIYAWLLFHLIFFSVIFPTTEGYRYLLAALPFFYFISLLGVWNIHSKKVRTIALSCILIGSFLISGQQLFERMNAVRNCEQPFIDTVRRETGLWIKENTKPDDLIAMKEIDQSAFYGERRMLSMDGTLDTRAIPFVQAQNQLGFIQQERPDYFILEEEMYREYPDWRNSNVLPLIIPVPKVGETKKLEDIEFTLVEKKNVGDAQSCSHFSDERHWWIFKITYP